MSTITIVPTVELTNSPPRIRLDVTDSGLPSYAQATVMRLNPDGTSSPVRTPDGDALPLTSSVGLLFDYEPPYGQPVSYTTVEDPNTVSAEVTVDSDSVWLIHVGVPELSMPVVVAALGSRTTKASRAVIYPMGRRFPIVHTDGARKAAEWTLTVYTASDDERAALDALLSDAGTLLLNVPVSRGFGLGAEYVSVGDVAENRLFRPATDLNRFFDLPLQVTDRPVGGSQAERTWTDVVSAYATWADVLAHFPTWQDVLSGP